MGQPVRLEVAGTPLPEVLATLAKRTGVALESEPELAELKLVVSAQDLPLRIAMRELGALFEASWSREGTGAAARYTLRRAPGVRRRALELRERFWQRQVEMVAALIDATHTADPQAALDAVNPTVARKWHRPQIPAALRLFDFATRGRYVGEGASQRPRFAYRDLTPEQQAEARAAILALAAWQESVGGIEQQRLLVAAAADPAELYFEGALSEMYQVAPSPEMKLGERVLNLWIREREGATVLKMGVHIGPMPLPEDDRGATTPLRTAAGADLTRAVRFEPEDRLVGLRHSAPLHRLAPELARQTDLSVFADYYYSRARALELRERWTGPLGAFLGRLEREGETTWSLDGQVLRLRSRRWFVDEERDPPRAQLEALVAAVRRQGRLGLDDAVRAAALTDAQLEGTRAYAGSQEGADGLWIQLQELGEGIREARPLLRLYGTLSPTQRRALPTGITLETLQIAQQPMFLEAALRLYPSARPEQRSRMRLRLDAGEDNVSFVALFPDDVRIDRSLPIAPPDFGR